MTRTLALLPMLFACSDLDEPATSEPLAMAIAAARGPSQYGGCGDIVVFAGNDADSHALVVTIPGDYALMATQTMEPMTLTLDATGETAVEARWGHQVTYEVCNDIPGGSVRGTATSVGGKLQVHIDPIAYIDPWYYPSIVTVTLDGVVLQTESGSERVVDLSLPPVEVGWFPG